MLPIPVGFPLDPWEFPYHANLYTVVPKCFKDDNASQWKSGKFVTWPLSGPLWPNFAFLSLEPLGSICTPNLKYLAPTVPEIWRGTQNLKSRSRDPFPPTMIYFWISFVSAPVVNLPAKFEVSSSKCSREMGVLKFGCVALPVNRGSSMTPYLNFPTPICLFTTQLSWGYDDD